MGYALDILNNIRNNASEDYKNRIPTATQTNLKDIGKILSVYPVTYNEFVDTLINRIGRTIIENKLFNNRLAKFKTGTITDDKDIQEIFVQMATAESSYDKTGSDALARRQELDTKVIYHTERRKDLYAITVGDMDFVRCFSSEQLLGEYVSAKINSIYSGANYDEWLLMKKLLTSYKAKDGTTTGYFSYAVPKITGSTGQKEFCKTLRKAVSDLTIAPSTQYNVAGVRTWSTPEDLVLFVNKDVVAEVDVELLAKAFKTSYTDMSVVPEIIILDDFNEMKNCYGLLVDKDFFRIFDTLSHFESQRNAKGMFTNYFYNVWQILSLSTFKNAVGFFAPTT